MKYPLMLSALIAGICHAEPVSVDNKPAQVSYTASIPEDIDAVIESLIKSSQSPMTSATPATVLNHDWQYHRIDNEFDDEVYKTAFITSTDGNAILSVGYEAKDIKHQNPIVVLMLSGDYDQGSWHQFSCLPSCPSLDLNIDGKKLPNIPMVMVDSTSMEITKPKLMLTELGRGTIVKMRIKNSMGHLYYTFEPSETFDINELKRQ